jgi:hypothetical protein
LYKERTGRKDLIEEGKIESGTITQRRRCRGVGPEPALANGYPVGFLKIGVAARFSSCAVGFFLGGFLTSRFLASLFPMPKSLPQFSNQYQEL